MRRELAVLLLAAGCGKPEARPDSASATAGASTVATVQPAADTAMSTPPADTAAIPPARAPRPGGQTGTGRSPASTGDEITGRVDEHGFDPATFIAITPSGGAQTRVSGAQLQALAAVKGAEVWARGRREANGFRVDTFEVRRANDRPVIDGTVSVSGTTVTVRAAGRTFTYADAPADLRNAAGARVWITAPVAGQAPTFGVIRPARQ